AWRAVERLGVVAGIAPAAAARLRAGVEGRLVETPKPGDPRLAHAVTLVIGGRKDAMAGAFDAAEALGYATVVIEAPTLGEARRAGPALLARADAVRSEAARPLCVIASGETTVKVTGRGKGGRNQELALSVAALLSDRREAVAVASIGTDG